MARILAIDWDGVEARFALGSVRKDRLIVWKAGSAPIADAAAAVADAEEDDEEDAERVPTSGENADDEEEDGGDSPLEIVETSGTKKAPVFDEDDEEDDEAGDPRVVSTVRKKKGESYKTSPLAKTLKALLRESRVGAATVLYSAERGDVDVLYTTVPQASDAETPELVLNQALRESTTFNETQPLDYLPLGTPSRTGTRSVVAVSIARDKLRRIRETLIGATRAPSKIELREPALAEFLRADFCKLSFDEPTLLIQALCDEVNLTLCDAEKNVLYFRSFKTPVDATAPALARRIRDEIARTLAVGVADLPEDAVVRKALFFSDASSLTASANLDSDDSDESAQITEIGEDGEDAASVVVGSLQLGERLAAELESEEIELEFANPFRVLGVELKSTEPENAGRFASLLGMLLAERPQNRPAIDLLHPREKPKPPKYWAIVAAFLVLVGAGFGAAWKWNKSELDRERAALAELQEKARAAQMEAQRKLPLANVLNSANAWRNLQGVVVLDELRDVALRIPQAPDLVVTRLGYLANQNGRPTFIIQAKIKSAAIYQNFRQSLIADGSHSVLGRGPEPNPNGGGYPYMFDARIVCQRRPAQTFVAKLPPELREISNDPPEYFAEREAEIRREREEAAAKAAAERAEAERRRQEEAQKQAEVARQAQEEAQKQAEAARQAQEAAAQNAQTAEQPATENSTAEQPTAENPAQSAQTQPSELERQAQFGFMLMRQKATLDARMQAAQNNMRAGRINQAQLQQTAAQYRALTSDVLRKWNALPEAVRNKANELWAEELKKQQNAQAGQNGQDAPAPEAPAAPAPETPAAPAPETPAAPAPETPAAPAPETPAAPAPEAPATPAPEVPAAPAPEAPATPAPETPAAPTPETPAAPAPETPATPEEPQSEGAPSAASERSQIAWTEA